MSDQEEPITEVVQQTDLAGQVFEPAASPRRMPNWNAPAWFLLGVIVGAVAFAIYTTATAKPTPPALDATALRGAARDGVIEAIATLQAGGGQQPSAESQEPSAVDQSKFTLRPANTISNPGAKVTIVEFSDFQCPFCGRFHSTVETQLMQNYVQTGKVNFVYKHSAFLGQESVWAAQASECAADQGKFWDFHELLFTRQNGENQGTFTKDKLLGFAQELKLDMTKFEPCLTNDQTLDRVKADTQEGSAAGVRGTPTFFINGQPLVGAQPYESFQAIIDKALSQ